MAEWARVVSAETSPDRVDDAVAYMRDVAVPGASALGGFRRGFWLMDRQTGKASIVTVFESQEALEASAAGAEKLRSGATDAFGASFTGMSHYEVVAEGGPPKEA